MTSLYLDGFDHYGLGDAGLANMLQGAWAQVPGGFPAPGPNIPSWGSRTGLYSLLNNAIGNLFRLVLPASKAKIFLSFGFSTDGLPVSNFQNSIVNFCTSGNTIFAQLWCQADGSLVLTGATTATVLGQSQGPIVISRNWHFLEMEFDPTGGNFVLRVDDPTAALTPIISVSGITFTSTTVGQLHFLDIIGGGSSAGVWMDDLFVRDALGGVNNGFLGDRRVATLLADADTTVAGWTPRYYKQLGAGILNNTAFANSATPNAGVTSPASSSLSLGAADFTLEGFVRFQALPTGTSKAVMFAEWDAANNQRSYELFLGSVALNGGAVCFQTSTDGTNTTVAQPVVFPWTPETDTWYHIALVRASGEDLLFINGQQQGLPIADANTYFPVAACLGVGAEVTGGGAFTSIVANTSLQGWLDEVRITVGFARYTSNFTPTTVEFPRGSGDAEWADVALLAGFDSLIQDESGFGRVLTARNNAVQQTVNDGPSVGVFSTIGKQAPDDNTFAEAPFLAATSVLTLSAQPAVADHVTVGTKDGTNAAVYTFESALTTAYQVLIDTNLQNTMQNLFNAINAGPGAGTKYGTGTTSNFDVNASQLPAGQMQVTANTAGSGGNAIATSASLTHGGGWTGSTLAGGANIPGPSEFQVQRPPPLTTIISAVQVTQRAFKSDAGACTINTAFIGAHGNATVASTHAPGITPAYFSDIYELDPDTSAAISPATIINGRIRLNRAT